MNAAGEGLARMLGLRDAIASTALSHPASCACLACRAAGGDKEAFTEILVHMEAIRDSNAEHLSLEGAAGESRPMASEVEREGGKEGQGG